jgi:hypothetical protein
MLSKKSGLIEMFDPKDEGITIPLGANNNLPVDTA